MRVRLDEFLNSDTVKISPKRMRLDEFLSPEKAQIEEHFATLSALTPERKSTLISLSPEQEDILNRSFRERKTSKNKDYYSGSTPQLDAFAQGFLPVRPQDWIITSEKHPVAEAVGKVAGLITTGALTGNIAPFVTFSEPLAALPTVAKFAAGRMAQSGVTFGLKELSDNMAEILSGDKKSFGVVVKDTLMASSFGAGLGAVGAIPAPIMRIPAEAAYGFVTAKLAGADNMEAGINAGMFAVFGLFNTKNLTEQYKRAAWGGAKVALENRLIKEGVAPDKAKAITERYFTWAIAKNGGWHKQTIQDYDKFSKAMRKGWKIIVEPEIKAEVRPEVKPQAQIESKVTPTPETLKAVTPQVKPTGEGKIEGIKIEPIVQEAISNTQGAKITPEGIELDISRYQKPEQFGEQAIRTGVFYLPETKSPYGKYYSTGKSGYGGGEKISGRTTYRNPIIVKAGTGGKGVEKAYDQVKGKGAYQKMRSYILEKVVSGINKNKSQQTVDLQAVLEEYNDIDSVEAYDLAEAIIRNSTVGNTLAYAIQENIAAHALREAGFDAVISHSISGGKPRLSEVFDLRATEYPSEESDYKYEDFYPKLSTPTGEVKPVEGIGETKTRGLSLGVEAKAIENKLTEGLGELPEYQTVNMKEQATKAQELLVKDYEKSKRIAMGEELPPNDIIPESVFVAVENKAVKEGDVATLKDLATSSGLTAEATIMGQRIRTLAERDPESPVTAIKEVVKAREDVAQKRLKTKKVGDAKKKAIKEVKESIRKHTSTKQDWADFVRSLQC